MGKTLQIRTDETLCQVLERIRKEVADSMKRTYNLDEITIHGTLASQIAAARLSGKKTLNFSIRRTGINSGILQLL